MFEPISEHYKCGEIFIRLIEEKDLETLREHRNDFSTWINLSDITLIYKNQQEIWYTKLINDKSKKYFIAYQWTDVDGVGIASERIGLIRIDEIDYINRSARVGCDIFKTKRNQGYGKQVMEIIIKYCFDVLNMNRLWLLVAEYNDSAISVYKKVGFLGEGVQKEALYRNGKYNDYIQMSLLKKDYKTNEI